MLFFDCFFKYWLNFIVFVVCFVFVDCWECMLMMVWVMYGVGEDGGRVYFIR